MYSAIKDIVVAMVFGSLSGQEFVIRPKIYSQVRSLTQERVSKGLSSTVKYREAPINEKY